MDAAWRPKRGNSRGCGQARARTHARKKVQGFGTRMRETVQANRSHEIGAGRVQSDDRQSAQRARAFRQVQTMIVLDSNVASEMMRATRAARRSRGWISLEPEGLLFECHHSPSKSALRHRVAFRSAACAKARPAAPLATAIDIRVLPFDLPAAIHAAQIDIDRTRRGRPAGFADTQIAGIAVALGAAIATRNVRHFADLSVEIINPWTFGLTAPPLTPAPCLPCRWPCRGPRR